MRNRIVILVSLLIAAMSFQFASAQNTPVVTSEVLAEFEQLIADEMAYYHIPGMAAAVIADGEIVYAQGFGMRDIENNLPFTTETLFRVGSTTKSMTSLIIAQLVEEGLLAWDTPITEIIPDFSTADPELTARLTLRDLMGMGTGLESNSLDGFYWGDWSFADLLDAIGRQAIAGEFGEHYAYNNEVYAAAGYAAALALGLEPTVESFSAMIEERVFAPIGMDGAIVTDDHRLLGDNFALPYEIPLDGDGFENAVMVDPPIGISAPAGAVWADVEDMARYLITQMSGGITPDGTRIVDEAALMETWQPGVVVDMNIPAFTDAHYGMGWVTHRYNGIALRWHDGGWQGYSTQIAIFPEANVGLVVFANSTLGGEINNVLTYAFAELLYGLEPQAAEFLHANFDELVAQLEMIRTQMLITPFNADSAAALVGDYENGWSVEVGEDALIIRRGGWEFRAVPMPIEGVYLVVNAGAAGVPIIFETDGDSVSMIVQLPAVELTLNRIE